MIYKPMGVCSQEMRIELKGDVIESVQIIGGCHGNTQGIMSLVKGMKVQEVIDKLEGIDGRLRGTSCPDQLSKALRLALEQEKTNE